VLEQLLELGQISRFQGKTKNPVTVEITEFLLGGDKRDRTADLLNAIEGNGGAK